MTEPMKILLLEDELQDCMEIEKYVDTLEDVTLVGCTGSSGEALEITSRTCPDAIIVDLELHQGSGNGLQFLAGLKQLHLSYLPYLLITTNNSSHTTHEAARTLGADFILTKYEADYSARYVIDFLRMMREIIEARNNGPSQVHDSPSGYNSTTGNGSNIDAYNNLHTVNSMNASNAAAHSSTIPCKRTLTQIIYEELNLVGISPKTVGYKYLADAIQIKMQDPDANIYAILGPRYQKSDASIERAMQNAINRAWRISDPDDLLTYYTARIRSDRGVPTIMEFIYYYATKLNANPEI